MPNVTYFSWPEITMILTNTTRYNKSEGAECDFFFMAKHTELDTAGESWLIIEILLYKKSM